MVGTKESVINGEICTLNNLCSVLAPVYDTLSHSALRSVSKVASAFHVFRKWETFWCWILVEPISVFFCVECEISINSINDSQRELLAVPLVAFETSCQLTLRSSRQLHHWKDILNCTYVPTLLLRRAQSLILSMCQASDQLCTGGVQVWYNI